MDNERLMKKLIDAAQEKRLRDLMALIDEYQPSLAHEDFKIKAKDSVKKSITLLYKNVEQVQISGQVQPSTIDGYQLSVEQKYKTIKGVFVVNPAGEWTYTITNQPMIDTISNDGSVTINETVMFSYFKDITINSVAHILSAYVAHYCPCEDMQKILDLGCCPNSNNANSQKIGLSATQGFSNHQALPDKYAGESRALVNAIKQGKLDMAETLINHSCPCCNGAGAKVTQNLIDLAQELKQDAIHERLLQAVN